MDTLKAPYVIDLKNGSKRLVFIGCDHNRDTTHQQYKVIAQYFRSVKPQITFNEGGQIPDNVRFNSYSLAILSEGETGALKYLSDSLSICMMNGDTPDSTEFKITLKHYPADQLFLYYMIERLVIPYLNGAYGNRSFEELYPKAINKWFVAEGFPLAANQYELDYLKGLYRKYIGHEFVLKLTPDVEKFDYINDGDCHFCQIGRSSKMVRDSILLNKIQQALKKQDRVMVTFGLGHALALEPAIRQLIASLH